jgi:hypothetical protein
LKTPMGLVFGLIGGGVCLRDQRRVLDVNGRFGIRPGKGPDDRESFSCLAAAGGFHRRV